METSPIRRLLLPCGSVTARDPVADARRAQHEVTEPVRLLGELGSLTVLVQAPS